MAEQLRSRRDRAGRGEAWTTATAAGTRVGTAGGGKIELKQAYVESMAFHGEATGAIEIANVLTNSVLRFPVTVSLNKAVTDKLGLTPSDTPTNAVFVALPEFLKMSGTLGNPKSNPDYVVLAKIALKSAGGMGGDADVLGQPAARRALQTVKLAGDAAVGREEVRKRIDQLTHGKPALQVSTRARWTLNGFSGGYARTVKAGSREVFGMADDGPYKTLMEGLEAFVAVMGGALTRDGEDTPNYAIDASGRRYLSARAQHRT